MVAGRSPGAGQGAKGRAQRRLEFAFGGWEEFLAARLDVEPAGLFLPGSYHVGSGEDVVVHLTFPGDADGARLSARVLWRRLRAGSDPSQRAGVGLVIRSRSMTAYRRLVQHAEGRGDLRGRKQERFDLQIPATCTFGRRQPIEVAGEITDVSAGGIALRLPHCPAVDDAVFLRIDDHLLGTVELAGFVSWVRSAGVGASSAAIGVSLQFSREEDRKTWQHVVGRAKAEARLSTEYAED
jgi:Tfp pilus assembly protein PilZ